MVEGEQDNPLFLRQVMENYKLKVGMDGMDEEEKKRGGKGWVEKENWRGGWVKGGMEG